MAVDPIQQKAIDLALKGEPVFITGSGGKGKSYTLNQLADENTIRVAPTGIAALNVSGVTCHSAFNLPFGVPEPKDFMTVSRKFQDLFGTHSPVKRIAFSELGMVRLDHFELINSKLQIARGNNLPWGGLDVVAEGDFFQIEAVVPSYEEEVYYSQYPSTFNFKSECFNFKTIELETVYRNSDKRQVEMLESIRQKDKYYKFALDTINKESLKYNPEDNQLVLCCFKRDAYNYNYKYFRRLEGESYIFKGRITGDHNWKDSVVPYESSFKLGAKVMFKANNKEAGYYNGERGVVSYIDNKVVEVKKDNGDYVKVEPHVWEKQVYKNVSGVLTKEVTSTFTQLPLVLAYAASIHSVQSMTLDGLALDLGRQAFSHGQVYVALSRARNLKNVSFVRPPRYEDIIVQKEVKEFYRSLRSG